MNYFKEQPSVNLLIKIKQFYYKKMNGGHIVSGWQA